MTSQRRQDGPRLIGRGPVVQAEYRIRLPNRRGILDAGYLSDQYRPFPPGAHVVLDCGPAYVMHFHTARTIGHALAHCGQITVTGTADRSEPGYADDDLIFGLDAIAHMIQRAAVAHVTETRK